ncbi:MAG: response regulator, partial [Chitinophagaceae bacterium]
EKKAGIADRTVFSLYCDADNNLWIGTARSGLYRYNARFDKATCYLDNDRGQVLNIKAITAYDDRSLIMGSDKGLIVFDRDLARFHSVNNDNTFDNLTDKAVFSIVKDRENAFWIGTYFGGVNYYSPYINRFAYYPSIQKNSSRKNIISSFADNGKNQIWVGTHDAGMALFDLSTGAFRETSAGVTYHDIQKILLDRDQLYAILNNNGIQRLDLRTNQVQLFRQQHTDSASLSGKFVVTLFKSSGGLIFLGLSDGVSTLDPVTGVIRSIPQTAGMSVKDLVEDFNGTIWLATHKHGLLRYDAVSGLSRVQQQTRDTDSLLTNNVNCLFHDSQNHLWIGTEGDGLKMLNLRTNQFELSFTEKTGLPSNIIYSIINDVDGDIWVSTSRGLARIDVAAKNIRTFGYMEAAQKIRYNPNCAIRVADNRLLFGGANGFTLFNPRELVDQLAKPALVLTGFQLFNKEMIPGAKASPLDVSINNIKKISLKYDQNSFTFDFIALSYISPEHNRYEYKLDGFDKEWNAVGSQNKAVYMNIPAGNYVFRVRAYNSDGLWNDLSTQVVVEVARPFWLSNLMIALYLVSIILAVYFFVRWYHGRSERRNKEKLYLYKVSKEKEIYESKINFFTNIAHEIRTPLSLIVAPLGTVMSAKEGGPETQSNLRIIERNTNRLLSLVNQLLDFRKIEEDMFPFSKRQHNVIEILKRVIDQYHETAKQHKISIRLELARADLVWAVDAEALYKIVSNLLSNALKHARNEILVDAGVFNGELKIAVRDDGMGIDPQFHERLFDPFFQIEQGENPVKTGSGLGLSLSQLLARKHGGKIEVVSPGKGGAVFIVHIPGSEGISEAGSALEAAHVQERSSPGEADLKPHILIVEDNPELRGFISNQLAELFYVLEAQNGRKAIDLLERETVDLIISDILMPEMNGLEFCNAVKSNPAFSHIPLILLSAKTDTPTKVQGLRKGADVYIDKPFSMEQLLAQINSIIENRNRVRSSLQQSPLQYFKQQPRENVNAAFVEKLNATILEHVDDINFTIDSLSEQFAMSRSNFHKKIKQVTGITPNDYIKLIRLNYSAELLSTGKYKVNEVCYMAGFNTPSYFSKCFFEQFGKLPKDFVQQLSDGKE